MQRFKNRVVVISGGAVGCGRAAAIRFASEGAIVSILDIDNEAGKQTLNRIVSPGGKGVFYPVDVSKRDQVFLAIMDTTENFQCIDVLFNHVGTVFVKPF